MTLIIEDDIDVLKKDERVVLDLHLHKRLMSSIWRMFGGPVETVMKIRKRKENGGIE